MANEATDLEAARAAKAKARRVFGRYGIVCGVGITRHQGRYAVRVNFEAEPDPTLELPVEIDGVPVVARVTGRIRKQGTTQA